MAATKRAMTSLPASQPLFLQTVEESDDDRISFRDSLKFFQEQLVINGASFPSPSPVCRSASGTLRKNGHRAYKEQISENNEKTHKDNDTFEDEIQSVRSCKIAIPTVDTILESVRVLRAIQKSQEERGSSWNFDVTSNSNVDSDIQCTDDWIQLSDANQNGYSDESANNERNEIQSADLVDKITTVIKDDTQIIFTKLENPVPSCDDSTYTVPNSESVNELCSFWPSNNLVLCNDLEEENAISNLRSVDKTKGMDTEIQTHNINGESEEKQLDKIESSKEDNINLDINAREKEKLPQQTDGNFASNNNISQDVNTLEISNTYENSKEDVIQTIKAYDTPESLRSACTDFLNQLNEKKLNIEDKTKEILLQESETTTEILKIETYDDIDTQKHDHFLLNDSLWKENCSPNDNGSTKIEHNDSDSGIGTQRSASSLSPNNPSQMQKDSWSDTCSSHYASAECSPYQSLNSVFESSIGLNNTPDETCDVENTGILARLTESEWEDASEKPLESTKHSYEDLISPVHQTECEEEKDQFSKEHLTDESHFRDSDSPSDNVELDTEISYCNFITNYTIENPCRSIETRSEETKPVTVICDNNEKESNTVNSLETDTCEQNIKTEEVVCEQTFDSDNTIFAHFLDSEKAAYEQAFDPKNTSFEQTSDADKIALEHSLDSEKSACEQAFAPKNTSFEQTSDTDKIALENSLDSEKSACEQAFNTRNTTCEQTSDTDKIALENSLNSEISASEQTFNTRNTTCEQTFDTEKIACEQTTDTEKVTTELTFDSVRTDSLISLDHVKDVEEDDVCESGRILKFTSSSCDLISIVDSLYTLKENPGYQIIPVEDASDEKFEETLCILSEGAFCEYPEENYLVIIENSILNITKDSKVLLSLNMKYGEVSSENNFLKIDNKMGRCVYIKCDFSDLMTVKTRIELHCLKHWQTDCLQLVHYPLKCHQNVVIIDIGSCSTRAGILMDQPTLPNLFFPTICATDKRTGTSVYGMEALQPEVRQHSNLSFPVRPTNKITKHTIDIDLMEGLFKKIFNDLKVDPTQYAVQVCLPRNLSINAQTALVKLLLEDLQVKAVSLTNQALLTLYAHDVSTAVVVDIGDRTDVLPVVDGFIVENGVTKLPHGGQRLIHHMKHGLAEKRITLSNDIDSFVVQYVIENLAYVAEDFDCETQISSQYPDIVRKTVLLQPASSKVLDCKSITLEEARFKIPEGLFNPDLWGLDSPGIHHLVQKAIQATSVDARKRIAENIYVSGGVTMLPGFVERLNKEVAKLSKTKIVPKVYASNYRYHCTYIGACKFAKMDVFPQVCISLKEYTKNSTSALKKCALYF